jgi:hypothetical protein
MENDMGIAQDLAFFNALFKKKKLAMDIGLARCGQLDKKHQADTSAYCHVNHRPKLLCCARAFSHQPQSRRRGVIGHELGHLILMKEGNFDHAEHEADAAVKRVLGLTIRYDKKGLQRL